MKTVVICGPQASSGVERVAQLVRENGGNPIIVPMLSGFAAVPNADVHVIFRGRTMDLSIYEAGQSQVGIIYSNNQICDSLGAADLEQIPGASLLHLSPAENVSGWIRRTLGGSDSEEEFNWDFGAEVPATIGDTPKMVHKTIACYSPLGGVGKTTTSVMLGTLAKDAGYSVCIVESDSDNAGVLQALGASPVRVGLGDILKEEWDKYELFAGKAQEFLQTIRDIKVLPIGDDSGGIKCDDTEAIKNLFRWTNEQGFDVVIYDLPPQLADLSVFSALEAVETVVLVGEPTTKAEEKLIRFVTRAQGLDGLGDIAQKSKLVVNKYIPNSGVKDTEISEATGVPLIATIPVDPEGYYRMINDRKLSIPADSPWRNAWAAIDPNAVGVAVVPRNAKKIKRAKGQKGYRPFWKVVLGIK